MHVMGGDGRAGPGGAHAVLALAMLLAIASCDEPTRPGTVTGVSVTPKGLPSPELRAEGTGFRQDFTVANGNDAARAYDLLAGTGPPASFLRIDSLTLNPNEIAGDRAATSLASAATAADQADSVRLPEMPRGTSLTVAVWYSVQAATDGRVDTLLLRARGVADPSVIDQGRAEVEFEPATVETGLVLNSVDISLTVFPAADPDDRRTIGLNPDGSPVGLAVRDDRVVVPLGVFPAAAIVDLRTDSVTFAQLPESSGATGVAFLNDSIAYVGNPNLNSVSVVNVRRATTGAEIPVGVFPQSLLVVDGRAFVMTAELDASFEPARTGRVFVIDPASQVATDTIDLTGLNPSDAAVGPDGLVYVLNAGSFGQGNGSLSIVDPTSLTETEHHVGFGDFPGDIAFGADGRVFVSSFNFGVAVWDPATDAFDRSPSDPLAIQGETASAGIGFDSDGRLYSLRPECMEPSVALRTNPDLSFDREIGVGICPIAIDFAAVSE